MVALESPMASITFPGNFHQSLLKSDNYPENIVPSSTLTYRSTLESYKRRLDNAAPDLCLVEGQDNIAQIFEVPFRDLETDDGKRMGIWSFVLTVTDKL
jgi:hypothetical protein